MSLFGPPPAPGIWTPPWYKGTNVLSPTPTGPAIDAILGPSVVRTRRAEIWEADGVTPYELEPVIIDGSISVDGTRNERRVCDLTFHDMTGSLQHSPKGFWYDKQIRVFLGVYGTDGVLWETQVGEFVIDNIDTDRFHAVHVTGRDHTKTLELFQFPSATTFVAGLSLDDIISGIASDAGITKMHVSTTAARLQADFTFSRNTTGLSAINSLTQAYGYEVFFDPFGYMVMRPFQDPAAMPSLFTFHPGQAGTLVDWKKISGDVNIFNHITVAGQNSLNVPVWAEVYNMNPASPTAVTRIGKRTKPIDSNFITSYDQALELARSTIRYTALESFEIDMTSIVIPWLDANTVVTFEDPSPAEGDPTSFLLSSFTLPLGLGTMNPVAKRVTRVD